MQGKAFSKLQCLPKDRFSKRTSGVVSPPLGKTDSCHKGKQDTLPHPHTGGHGPLSFTALLKVSSSLPYITHFLLTHPSSSSLPHEAGIWTVSSHPLSAGLFFPSDNGLHTEHLNGFSPVLRLQLTTQTRLFPKRLTQFPPEAARCYVGIWEKGHLCCHPKLEETKTRQQGIF